MNGWREVMLAGGSLVWEMRARGKVEVLQEGEVLNNDMMWRDVKGPTRVRRVRKNDDEVDQGWDIEKSWNWRVVSSSLQRSKCIIWYLYAFSRNFVAYLCLVKSILTHGRASTSIMEMCWLSLCGNFIIFVLINLSRSIRNAWTKDSWSTKVFGENTPGVGARIPLFRDANILWRQ